MRPSSLPVVCSLFALSALARMAAPSQAEDPVADALAEPLAAAEGGAAAAGAAPVAAEVPVIQRENLINNSPFRIRAPRRDSSVPIQALEIRGFMGTGRNLEVSLSNPDTLECQWVRVRDPDARWFVESADPVKRTAEVRMDGVSITVRMVKPAELLPPAPPPVPSLAGAGGAVPAPRPPVTVTTSRPAPVSPAGDAPTIRRSFAPPAVGTSSAMPAGAGRRSFRERSGGGADERNN